jgi:nucleoid-associated protein YgaU
MARSTLVRRMLGLLGALALTLGLTAGMTAPAQATVWDRVAKCESGGRWKINTGNGYYGGLQFSRSTWRAYGGAAYAKTANRASKGEQIAIARRTLAGQGPRAWSCARRAHLTKANGRASRHATPSSNPGAHKHKHAHKKSAASKSDSPTKHYTGGAARGSVKVKSGDTLAKIAKRYHVHGGWKGLWKLNKSAVEHPNHIRVGQVLKIK